MARNASVLHLRPLPPPPVGLDSSCESLVPLCSDELRSRLQQVGVLRRPVSGALSSVTPNGRAAPVVGGTGRSGGAGGGGVGISSAGGGGEGGGTLSLAPRGSLAGTS